MCDVCVLISYIPYLYSTFQTAQVFLLFWTQPQRFLIWLHTTYRQAPQRWIAVLVNLIKTKIITTQCDEKVNSQAVQITTRDYGWFCCEKLGLSGDTQCFVWGQNFEGVWSTLYMFSLCFPSTFKQHTNLLTQMSCFIQIFCLWHITHFQICHSWCLVCYTESTQFVCRFVESCTDTHRV